MRSPIIKYKNGNGRNKIIVEPLTITVTNDLKGRVIKNFKYLKDNIQQGGWYIDKVRDMHEIDNLLKELEKSK